MLARIVAAAGVSSLIVAGLSSVSGAVTPHAGARAPGPQPEFAGTYRLRARIPNVDYSVGKTPDDGLLNLDQRWVTLGGSCSSSGCSVRLRRVGLDGRYLPVTLRSRTPGGPYTSQLPSHDRDDCDPHPRVHESMLVRLYHVHRVGGRLVATRLFGHIYGTWQCGGGTEVDEAFAEYNGRRTGP